MRNGIVIAGILAVFSAGFFATSTSQKAEALTSHNETTVAQPIQSAKLTEGVLVDNKAREKPIRVILPSPYETAAR